jgi:ABC-2 type transport system permease protein
MLSDKNLLNDIGTILWKEWHEMFQQKGLRGAITNWAVLVGLSGVFMPINFGPAWLVSPLHLLLWSWLPLLAVMQIVSDTFAGERERHTLETLLATRLPDRTILWGKVLSVVLYGWSIQAAGLLLGWICVNAAYWNGALRFFSAPVLLGVVPLTALAVILVACIGTLVSLRSGTVRQAYQKMMIAFLAIVFVPVMAIQVVPGAARVVAGLVSAAPDPSTYAIAMLVLAVIDVGILIYSAQRFQRATLILEI